MRLLIKFPTKGRPEKFIETFTKYIELQNNKDNFYFVTLDIDDYEQNKEFYKKISYKNVILDVGESISKIHAINRGIDSTKGWDILLLASDDMIPQVKGWDSIIIEDFKNSFIDTDGVLHYNDGFQGSKLNTLCILGKQYYDRFNYIYYPYYKSTWSDNEFMEVSRRLDKVKYFDKCIIKHEHPDWGYGRNDKIHFNNYNNLDFDKNLFYKREKSNFGL